MKTWMTRSAALALGVAALVGVAASVARADDPIVIRRPVRLRLKNDLAAVSLVTTFMGDVEAGTAKIVMMGTCKNVGLDEYKPGDRALRIERKQGNSWVSVVAKKLPALKPNQSFTIVAPSSLNDTGEYRLAVTGRPGDEDPKNDIYVPQPEPVEVPR